MDRVVKIQSHSVVKAPRRMPGSRVPIYMTSSPLSICSVSEAVVP